MMRKGWQAWVDAGCPELSPEVKAKYKFTSRGEDDMLRVSWDTCAAYLAKAQIKIAERYSGEAGARRLREQGYPQEMIESMKGAGVRTFKYRPGMALLGLIGKIGFGRMVNSNQTLLDAYIRKVGPDKAIGGRSWSSYTWHGDQLCKQFTDRPILIRTDTLTYLDPRDVVKDYKLFDLSKGYTTKVQTINPDYRERLGDFMVWDTAKNQPIPMHRELVGQHMVNAGVDPSLEGTYRVKLLDGREVDVMPVFQMYKIHVKDFDLDTTHQICRSPKDLIVRWARD